MSGLESDRVVVYNHRQDRQKMRNMGRKEGDVMETTREIGGKYTSARVFTTQNAETDIDDYAVAQIQVICDNAASEGSRIRVMPDVHPGKVGPIGLTMTVEKRLMPNIVGVDIGCGMTIAQVKAKKLEFQKLDVVIRDNVPAGFRIRSKKHHFTEETDLSGLHCYKHINENKALLSLGTLGGGNHFIEADVDEAGMIYFVIHTGSRHLGTEVTNYYLDRGSKLLKDRGEEVPYELTYLEGELLQEYLEDLQVVQEFASLNRETILNELVKGMGLKVTDTYSCIHNYVDFATEIDGQVKVMLRKGAISAKKGEPVIIPINMRDGVLLGTGLGNEEWNCSAPHGSGRILKRADVKERYTVSAFKAEMKGIYSTCINSATLDEAPFSYRKMEEIAEVISDTVRIDKVIRPIYNFKAGEK